MVHILPEIIADGLNISRNSDQVGFQGADDNCISGAVDVVSKCGETFLKWKLQN